MIYVMYLPEVQDVIISGCGLAGHAQYMGSKCFKSTDI